MKPNLENRTPSHAWTLFCSDRMVPFLNVQDHTVKWSNCLNGIWLPDQIFSVFGLAFRCYFKTELFLCTWPTLQKWKKQNGGHFHSKSEKSSHFEYYHLKSELHFKIWTTWKIQNPNGFSFWAPTVPVSRTVKGSLVLMYQS